MKAERLWVTSSFGEVGRVYNGNSISEQEKKNHYEGLDEGIPYIATKDVGFDHSITYESGVKIPHEKQEKFKLAPKGAILVCAEGGSAGRKIAQVGQPVYFGNKLYAISPTKQHNSRFLFYYCLSKAFANQFKEAMTGLIGGVSLNRFKEIKLEHPSLTEQERIASILDSAFDDISTSYANAERNLQNARSLFASHLESIFIQQGKRWKKRHLGELCDLLNGFAFKSGDAIPNSQTQVVRMGNLYGNKLDLDRNPVFYPDSFSSQYRRYALKCGDIIMSLTGTTGKEDFGFAVKIPECSHSLLMNQRIAKFDAINENIVNRDYLLHYLRSREFLDILYPTANGTRQANLSSVTIKTLPIPLCPLNEQYEIATCLESLSEETLRLESIYLQKLHALAELKQSLLHQAFSGQL